MPTLAKFQLYRGAYKNCIHCM